VKIKSIGTARCATRIAQKISTVKKCLFYRHFCIIPILVERISLAKCFFSAPLLRRSRVRSTRMEDEAVTHKIMQSHCYFFSAVVIRW